MPTKSSLLPSINSKSLKLTALLLLSPLFFFGQTLTGLWTGALHNDSSTIRKDQSFEIALTEYKGKVYGYSRSEFIVDDTLYYILKRVKGTIDGDVCEVKDDEIISYNFRGKLDKGIKVTSTFRKNQNDSTWYLDGDWKTNATKKYYSVTGKVNLAEEKDLTASKIFPHLEEVNLSNDVAFYKERTESVPTVKVIKPERNYTGMVEKNISIPTSAGINTIAVAPMPMPVAAVITSTSIDEKEEAPSIKKTNNDIAKTETKKIVDAGTSVSPSAPVIVENKKAVLNNSISSTTATPEKLGITTTIKNETASTNSSATQNNIAKTNVGSPPATNKPTGNEVAKATTNASTKSNDSQNNISKTATTSKATTAGPSVSTSVSPVIVENKKPVAASQPIAKNNVTTKTIPSSTKTTPVNETKKQDAIVTAPVKTPVVAEPIAEIKKPAIDITEKASSIAGRKSEFTQVVNFKSDSLLISLYDNGEIDGDTVTVYMNGEILMAKQGLKASAIKKTIYLTAGQTEDFTLVMFAESLGKYPPNTGLLVIKDGDDIYNLRFSSDYQKNTGIVFRRKK